MTTTANLLSEVNIYVGTYKKYNEGSIFGKWLTLGDYSDMQEFWEACKELHNDEEDPEFMFQDYETPDILKGFISECGINDDIFYIAEKIEGCGIDFEVLEACENIYSFKDIEKCIDYAQEIAKATYEKVKNEYELGKGHLSNEDDKNLREWIYGGIREGTEIIKIITDFLPAGKAAKVLKTIKENWNNKGDYSKSITTQTVE